MKLSHSSMQLYQTCPRKFFYQKISGWTPRSKASALVRGSAIHEALDIFYKTKDISKAKESAQNLLSQEELFPAEKEFLSPIIESTLDLYFKNPEIQEYEVLESELDLCKPLTPGIEYTGKVDTIVKFHGIDFLRETKTTTQLASHWEQKYSLDNQTLGYLWLLGEKVSGIILDLIRVPDGKRTKYPEFVRSAYTPHPSLIPEWEKERISLAKTIEKDTTYPKNTASCFDYSRACDFFPFCNKDLPASELPNMFVQRKDRG